MLLQPALFHMHVDKTVKDPIPTAVQKFGVITFFYVFESDLLLTQRLSILFIFLLVYFNRDSTKNMITAKS